MCNHAKEVFKMSDFTPGPWEIKNGTLTGPNGREIYATVYVTRPVVESEFTPKWEANARLIASAPDLLEALVKIAKTVDGAFAHGISEDSTALLEIINDVDELSETAIAKAEGRE
jgi:hypothetical protein